MRNRILQYKTLLSNIGYLSILQGVNLAVPLITLPYLLKVLGSSNYGLVVYAQAITSYLVILVSYGFNITAVREVSIHRNDSKKLSEIVSAVYIIKACFFVLANIILYLSTFVSETLSNNFLLLQLSMWVCLYEVLFPEWYFQGIEKMKFITLLTTIFRIIFLVLIFILIKNEDDYLRVPLINGIGSLIASIISIVIVFCVHRVKFVMQPWTVIVNYLKNSFPIFIYKFSQVYIKLNKVLLGTFVGMVDVAYYDLAEKIVNLLRMPLNILGQAVFPKNVKDRNKAFIRNMFSVVMLSNIVLIGFIWFSSPFIANFLGGSQMLPAVDIIRLLSFTLLPVTFNSLFASQTLLSFGFNKHYMWAIIVAGSVYLLSVGVVHTLGWWSLFAVGFSVLLSECTTSFISGYFMKKLNLIR